MRRDVLLLLCLVTTITFSSVIYYILVQKDMNIRYQLFGTSMNSSSYSNVKKPLVIWSNDYHIGPIQDLKHLLQPIGVKFIDKSLSGHCRLTKTCASNLRVINRKNAMRLNPDLISKFYEAYENDSEMKSVDAFVCFHPSAMCELFMPFNKSIIVIASTRYEIGRWPAERWKQWNKNLIKISQGESNVVGGNNLYDVKYIEYFTGLKPLLLQSFCGYIEEEYKPIRPGFILSPVHRKIFQKKFLDWYNKSCQHITFECPKLHPLREIYPKYKYSDLISHQGIVYVPYQVSVMSLFEQYRMNIPLFFPSFDLLTKWQFEHHVMKERTWDMVFGKIPSNSSLPPHKSQHGIPDPNCETNETAIAHWVKYADFYRMQHITYFNSTDDLIVKLGQANLREISENMKKANSEEKIEVLAKWQKVLAKISGRQFP